jgi:hypothetical protein
MNILEYADAINKEIEITYYANQSGRFSASFSPMCEIKNDEILTSVYGNGLCPQAALNNFAKEISGKIIVFDANSEKRLELRVPNLEQTAFTMKQMRD